MSLDVNGLSVDCAVPADDAAPEGASSFGLLAAALSACTAMSVRSFLQRWDLGGDDEVEVDVFFQAGPPRVLHRRVGVRADLGVGIREQLAAVVDNTPVTVLLRDALVIVTRLDVGPDARPGD
ncbi:OsmC family protein [Actinomycetospora atypica]|uniref:OsmC family protein n=1 Tax=Actinomycetospora atypica TaxID=1290095 RepID=A0ABV9YT28_9PSEU